MTRTNSFLCQLSTRFIEEGIEFLSLNQSDQEALKDDVLGELYHATRHSADALVEWEELTVTMRAYCGVTCVSLVGSRSSGEEKQRDETVERIEVRRKKRKTGCAHSRISVP